MVPYVSKTVGIPNYRCSNCDAFSMVYWHSKSKKYMCKPCIRKVDPPFMTLVSINRKGCDVLWNVEIGAWEEFKDIEDIGWCGWMPRSIQKIQYNTVPRLITTVYHMEFYGEANCSRCVDYPYFEPWANDCVASCCKNFSVPKKPIEDREYPVERSRYVKWLKMDHY